MVLGVASLSLAMCGPAPLPFTADRWKAEPGLRHRMVQSLVASDLWVDLPPEALTSILGRPGCVNRSEPPDPARTRIYRVGPDPRRGRGFGDQLLVVTFRAGVAAEMSVIYDEWFYTPEDGACPRGPDPAQTDG